MPLLVPVPVPAPPESGATAPRPHRPTCPVSEHVQVQTPEGAAMLHAPSRRGGSDGLKGATSGSHYALWKVDLRDLGGRRIVDVGVQPRGRDLEGGTRRVGSKLDSAPSLPGTIVYSGTTRRPRTRKWDLLLLASDEATRYWNSNQFTGA